MAFYYQTCKLEQWIVFLKAVCICWQLKTSMDYGSGKTYISFLCHEMSIEGNHLKARLKWESIAPTIRAFYFGHNDGYLGQPFNGTKGLVWFGGGAQN